MDMTPDEIVMRYRQAKHKGEQIKILADLSACNIEDILKVLVDHGGYELARISRAIGAARKSDAAPKEPKKQIKYKKPEIIPEPPKPEPVKEPNNYPNEQPKSELKPYKQSIDSALDVLRVEIADINRQQYELDMRKAELYKKLWDMLGEVQ